jgi:hypothetical protein
MQKSLESDVRFWEEFISGGEEREKAKAIADAGFTLYSLLSKDFADIVGDADGAACPPELLALKLRGDVLVSKLIYDILESDYYRKETIGESKNKVFVISQSGCPIVMKVIKDEQDFAGEEDATEVYRKLIEGIHRKGAAPKSWGIVEQIHLSRSKAGNDYLFVTRREAGKTFYKVMEEDPQRAKRMMPELISFMAFLHLNYRGPNKGVLNLFRKVQENLFNPHLGLKRSLAESILSNIDPVLEPLVSSWYVHNCDFHPENILIADDGRRIKLDCARGNLIPCEADLANLLIYKYLFRGEELPASVEHYCGETRQDFSSALPKFYNALILRAFALASAWSDPERQSMHSKREDMLANASLAVELLGIKCPGFYNPRSKKYASLNRDFIAAQKSVAQKTG